MINAKKYLQTLQELTRLWKDLKLVYAADDEGNHFQEVHYPPTIGHFDGQDFYQMTQENMDKIEVNAICIN
jgi:hypothetical protein